MKYIQELREGERLSQIFFCKNKTIATTKAGKTYYSLTLQDKTGVPPETVDAKELRSSVLSILKILTLLKLMAMSLCLMAVCS